VRTTIARIQEAIRSIPDFPKPGILFRDITPVLQDANLFRGAVRILAERARETGAEAVAAVDARGFLFAGAMADRLRVGLVPIRKKGKLPYHVHEETYSLEYGTATLTIHQDAFKEGTRVVLVDDLLATGGTAKASAKLIEKAGGQVAGVEFLVELTALNGRGQLAGYEVFAPIRF
jgi:adenine phosphoribosyltransferase